MQCALRRRAGGLLVVSLVRASVRLRRDGPRRCDWLAGLSAGWGSGALRSRSGSTRGVSIDVYSRADVLAVDLSTSAKQKG